MRSLWLAVVAAGIGLCIGFPDDYSRAAETPGDLPDAKSKDVEWQLFTKRLAGVLGEMKEHDFLILSERWRNVYIQLADKGASGKRVEAVGEQFYPGLSKPDKDMLHQLGWNPPTFLLGTKFGAPQPPGGSCNYYMDSGKMPPLRLACLIVRTIREVYHTRDLSKLEYEAFYDDHTVNYEISVPELGLKPAEKIVPSAEQPHRNSNTGN